jgi:hypothetical protein
VVNAAFFKFLLIPHLVVFGVWAALVIYSASWKYQSILIGDLALLTSLIQLCSYGAGLVVELFKKSLKG